MVVSNRPLNLCLYTHRWECILQSLSEKLLHVKMVCYHRNSVMVKVQRIIWRVFRYKWGISVKPPSPPKLREYHRSCRKIKESQVRWRQSKILPSEYDMAIAWPGEAVLWLSARHWTILSQNKISSWKWECTALPTETVWTFVGR